MVTKDELLVKLKNACCSCDNINATLTYFEKFCENKLKFSLWETAQIDTDTDQ